MKLFTSVVATAAALTLTASAQSVANKAKVESVLVLKDGSNQKVFLISEANGQLSYVQTKQATAARKQAKSSVKSITMLEPRALTASIELFEGRKYREAQQQLAKIKDSYTGLKSLAGNPSTLAAFYELECLRKQLRVKQVAEGLAAFDGSGLTNPAMIQQVEAYKFWELVNKKDWARLDALAAEWAKKSLPVTVRAQVEYCHGLALEGLGKKSQALTAFARALSADFTKSEEISRGAALAALRIYNDMPEVKQAKSDWGLDSEDKNGLGYAMLLEANSIVRLYNDLGLGAGEALPAKYASYLDYTPTKK